MSYKTKVNGIYNCFVASKISQPLRFYVDIDVSLRLGNKTTIGRAILARPIAMR